MKPTGGILLVIGVLLALFGVVRLNSPGSQIMSMFAGPDIVALGSIALGVIAVIAGIVMLARSKPQE